MKTRSKAKKPKRKMGLWIARAYLQALEALDKPAPPKK